MDSAYIQLARVSLSRRLIASNTLSLQLELSPAQLRAKLVHKAEPKLAHLSLTAGHRRACPS